MVPFYRSCLHIILYVLAFLLFASVGFLRYGGLHLFNFPAAKPTPAASLQAHCPPLAGAAFVSGDTHVVTGGGSASVSA